MLPSFFTVLYWQLCSPELSDTCDCYEIYRSPFVWMFSLNLIALNFDIFSLLSTLYFWQDIQNRPSNVYWCDFEDCCKVFKSLFCLEMHREMVHHLDKICVCGYPACDVRYSSILLLRQHINISHLQHKFMCDVCWEVCSSMDAFTKHKAAHDNEREKVHVSTELINSKMLCISSVPKSPLISVACLLIR